MRFFIDCTQTYFDGGTTGIPHVTRAIANACAQAGQETGFECYPVARISDRVFKITVIKDKNDLISLLRKKRLALRKKLKTLMPSSKDRIMKSKNEFVVTPAPSIIKTLIAGLKKYQRNLKKHILTIFGMKIEFQAGDVFLLLEPNCDQSLLDVVDKAKLNGAKVGFVLYDLIPLKRPEWLDASFVAEFKDCFQKMLEIADFCLAISESSRKELESYLSEETRLVSQKSLKIGAFSLGVMRNKQKYSKIRSSLKDVFSTASKPKPYLCVSTLEPRKNQSLLLDVFEELWSRDIHARLCLVGGVWWRADALLNRILHHPQWQKNLFMFNDLSDDEIVFCYQNAKALISASLAEGFGLPVVEGLSLGLPVFASDIPSHREIGQDYCAFFDPKAREPLFKLLENFELSGRFPSTQPTSGFSWPDWLQSAKELIDQMRICAS